jgi:hypothetical protein
MYKLIGADNREYGPVSQEEVLQWIAQGRANARTIAKVENGAWKPLATFDEFKAALNIPVTAAPAAEFSTFPVHPAGAKTNTAAVSGVVLGILGLVCCCCPFVASALAVIFGVVGLNQIKSRPGAYTTDPTMAKIAIGLGIAGVMMHVGLQFFGGGITHELEKLIKWR